MKQSEVLAPTPIKYPVAYAGIKNNIPLLPTGTNNASITEGFPEMTMKALKDGGLPPRGEDFNGLFYLTTDQKAFFQDGGYITFDTAVSMLIGGYPKGAILDYYNESTNYYTKVTSLIDDNTNNFVENPALIDGINWQFVDFGTGANENLSNITPLALDRINQSKALITGNVANYEEELNQITQMSHSTFDLSKFTVVGSPNITNDGVASGFSSSNCLTFTCPITDFSKPWELILPFTPDGTSPYEQIIFNIGANFKIVRSGTNAKFLWLYMRDSTSFFYNGISLSSNILSGHSYILKLGFTGSSYYAYLKTDNGSFVNVMESAKNNVVAPNTTTARISAISYATGTYFAGSIDLKQFSIAVDGVEVFSGNKTGIDTIKPDDYTVVGTPTISADGIASGFSDKNYIKTIQLSELVNQSWDIQGKWISTNSSSTNEQSLFQTYYRVNLGLFYQSSSGLFSARGRFGDATSSTAENINMGAKNIGINLTSFDYKMSFDIMTGQYTVYYKTANDTDWLLAFSYTPPTTNKQFYLINAQPTEFIYISGGVQFEYYSIKDSIDLNSLKIYVDGNLVYQPCLKIPYTESKTGSKIVQSVYRDRVADMYEQFGYAPYYTLSDTDFTLPQGELYGYLEKRARDIAHPVAQPFYRFSDEINEDEVRLEGAEVDKGLYLAIEQKLSAYCTAGSTADKICLPDFRDRVPWGASTFGYIEAGLPDHNHTTTAFYWGSQGSEAEEHADPPNFGSNISLTSSNASSSNSIYGNSTTVQPPSFKVRWLARYK